MGGTFWDSRAAGGYARRVVSSRAAWGRTCRWVVKGIIEGSGAWWEAELPTRSQLHCPGYFPGVEGERQLALLSHGLDDDASAPEVNDLHARPGGEDAALITDRRNEGVADADHPRWPQRCGRRADR